MYLPTSFLTTSYVGIVLETYNALLATASQFISSFVALRIPLQQLFPQQSVKKLISFEEAPVHFLTISLSVCAHMYVY